VVAAKASLESEQRKQTSKLRELMKYNCADACDRIWMKKTSQHSGLSKWDVAGKFLDGWCTRAMRSQLERE